MAVAGLTKDDFTVELSQSGEAAIEANIINAMYVQDDYWLLVQAPHEASGAKSGEFYDLTVALGSTDSDSQTARCSTLNDKWTNLLFSIDPVAWVPEVV